MYAARATFLDGPDRNSPELSYPSYNAVSLRLNIGGAGRSSLGLGFSFVRRKLLLTLFLRFLGVRSCIGFTDSG